MRRVVVLVGDDEVEGGGIFFARVFGDDPRRKFYLSFLSPLFSSFFFFFFFFASLPLLNFLKSISFFLRLLLRVCLRIQYPVTRNPNLPLSLSYPLFLVTTILLSLPLLVPIRIPYPRLFSYLVPVFVKAEREREEEKREGGDGEVNLPTRRGKRGTVCSDRQVNTFGVSMGRMNSVINGSACVRRARKWSETKRKDEGGEIHPEPTLGIYSVLLP